MLKFSAMEIYNESVRDLLSSDSTPLRLLDDPEKGTVVEKLTEITLRDHSHLRELLAVCEAERQIGETSLNETSSRSHQILRLTVESSARELSGAENSSILAATVNFVDLAGSERASQTLSAGTRLKEGCHINRSLLTLGTVIRKLSKGRNGHVPYRDSKLTRILQHSLGGNARTAIICTMSPAHSHVEQSRNTLLFALCAKEVSTNAQVNVVMSEKALVKQLQRELARLESELRNLGTVSVTSNHASILKEKELLIEKMDKEIKELTKQRDVAQSRLEAALRTSGDNQVSKPWVEPGHLARFHEKSAWLDEHSTSDTSEAVDPLRLDVSSNMDKREPQLPENSDEHYFSDGISPRLFMNKYFGPDPCQGWEKIAQKTDTDSDDSCKEVRCVETDSSRDRNAENHEVLSPKKENGGVCDVCPDHSYEALKQKIQDMQTTIDCIVSPYPIEPSPCSSDTDISDSRSINLSKSRSCRAILTSNTTISSPSSDKAELPESTPPNGFERNFPRSPEVFKPKASEPEPKDDTTNLSRKNSHTSVGSVSTEEKEQNTKTSSEAETESLHSRDTSMELDEVVNAKSKKNHEDERVQEAEPKPSDPGKVIKDENLDIEHGSLQRPSNWAAEFGRQRREIIELWDACNIPLVHRTYFFLLFKGDPSDSVYMEVELRRLTFLRNALSSASSLRALSRERQMLSKQILKKFSSKEREALYQKWGIKLDSKQRRVQLSRRIWTDTEDMDHVKDSATLVARLVGFVEQGEAPKELFGLSFSPQQTKFRTFSWKNSMSSLN